MNIEQAARAYVVARYELRGAAPSAVLEAVVLVDWAWHELTVAVGMHDPECCGCDDDERIVSHADARHYVEPYDETHEIIVEDGEGRL